MWLALASDGTVKKIHGPTLVTRSNSMYMIFNV